MYNRISNIRKTNSFFLFGPRGTGKTTLLKRDFEQINCLWINLLHEDEVIAFTRNPKELYNRIKQENVIPDWVVIDEVQKLPFLLDEVHSLIESDEFSPKIKFALTGSSARKLKRGGANLLAGRAFVNNLHPLTVRELPHEFGLEKILRWGSLPQVVSMKNDEDRIDFLRSYVTTYLQEEIRAEQIIRNIDPFRRFLPVAAQGNGQLINYTKIGRDCLTDKNNVERYYSILEDTLLGFFIEPFHASFRKRLSHKPKFYFFDLGVKRAIEGLLQIPIEQHTYSYGKAFEHFIILEFIRLNNYLKKDFKFSFFRTKNDVEIDLVIERPGRSIALVEIKSSLNVDTLEIRKLARLSREFPNAEAFILSNETNGRLVDGVFVMPWKEGIDRIFS